MAARALREQVEGVVAEVVPRGLYRVVLEDGRVVTASLGAVARRATVKVIPGDRVRVSLSTYQPGEARIEARIG
jgi:translation initiation factor IF-1